MSFQGSFIDNRYKRLELIGEGSEAYFYRVEDFGVSKDSPFRMYILNFKSHLKYFGLNTFLLWSNLSKAMKRFKAVDFSLNSKIKKQIQQEVNILKQIEHDNLVK